MLLYTAPDERAIELQCLGDYITSRVKTWIGGFRNRPQEWTEPMNWFPVGVPGPRDKVLIGGYTRHCCHVATGTDEILSLHILYQATVRIGISGRLTIDGTLADPLGLICGSGLTNDGTLEVLGSLGLYNTTSGGVENGGLISNRGTILVDHSVSLCAQRWGHCITTGERILGTSQV